VHVGERHRTAFDVPLRHQQPQPGIPAEVGADWQETLVHKLRQEDWRKVERPAEVGLQRHLQPFSDLLLQVSTCNVSPVRCTGCLPGRSHGSAQLWLPHAGARSCGCGCGCASYRRHAPSHINGLSERKAEFCPIIRFATIFFSRCPQLGPSGWSTPRSTPDDIYVAWTALPCARGRKRGSTREDEVTAGGAPDDASIPSTTRL
jgi:hypothetical protein